MNYKGQDLRPGFPHTFTVETPLVFQWLPRRYGYPIPEKYLERLSEWAKREDTRVVKLVINGSGFTPTQRKELENKISNREFNPNKNIELIDFNELDLGEYEFSFHLQTDKKTELSKYPLYTVSQYFKDLYSIPKSKRLSFGVEIDSMRIFMLLVLKSPMIYFDFDILPKEDKKVGEIEAKQGFLVAENDRKGYDYDGMASIENAIIAVSDAGRVKVTEFYNEIKHRFQKYYPLFKLSEHEIYKIMEEIVYFTLSNDVLLISSYQDYNKRYNRRLEEARLLMQETFGFKTNGGEVDIQYDNSWTKNKDELYTKEEIAKIDSDTRVVTSMQIKSVSSCENMYRG
ncbi:hypothetical protein [Wolbachia endosymbiont of Bemisia tabaci]|uniref:hypothetical protein n=1 Tax=Wolbachia endosymbiont of Bemisia tabaci TaxID=215173 RepID=UPI001FE41994|nr:hypothetical protein [Wolbachia endosymbiont of Bemisia tabaci]